MSVSSSQAAANGKAINKGTILKLSVDHIRELRDQLAQYKNRVQELEHHIEAAKRGEPIPEGKMQIKPAATVSTDANIMQPPQPQKNDKDGGRHERMGSLQFQQQFGNLHIGTDHQP
ncbi:hypothetical protein BCR43DRAFT_482580 [Syncephalastrum racemosum]|uniref:BHLH domain-containing protein n=1 Tax=Syncephalastrum racemosum TaxID=13706 RepID=A0A1X2HTT9_SYNRA|nr:hypothetical protein BCR43DRAFT_482580 [Syncephalastrum racemosum]